VHPKEDAAGAMLLDRKKIVICASDDMVVVIHGGGHRRGVDLARIFVINSRELSSSRSGDYCSSPSHRGDGGKGS
jgi:hypothetical protein